MLTSAETETTVTAGNIDVSIPPVPFLVYAGEDFARSMESAKVLFKIMHCIDVVCCTFMLKLSRFLYCMKRKT